MGKIILINSNTMGSGSEELGKKLMGSFLRKLCSEALLKEKPAAIIFYNSGVQLLADDSTVLDAVDRLFKAGIDILACGTCLGYYQLENRLSIGRVSNMQEIASMLLRADAVITL